MFGVPAVLRANIPIERLGELLDLVPYPDENAKCYIVDARDKLALGRSLMTRLDELKRFPGNSTRNAASRTFSLLTSISG